MKNPPSTVLFCVYLLVIEAYALQKIVLETSDHQKFEIDKNSMRFIQDSQVLKDCVESIDYDSQNKKEIFISGLKSSQLGELLCCYKQLDTQPEKQELLYKYSRNIISLLNSADYLGMHELSKLLKKSLLKNCNNKKEVAECYARSIISRSIPFCR